MGLAGSKRLISKTSRVIAHWRATQGASAAPFSERAVARPEVLTTIPCSLRAGGAVSDIRRDDVTGEVVLSKPKRTIGCSTGCERWIFPRTC
jgi:hypothetical protein